MNLLFTLAQAAGFILVAYLILIKLFGPIVKNTEDRYQIKDFYSNYHIGTNILCVIVSGFIIYTSLMAHGPRLGLDANKTEYTPEKQEIKAGSQMIENKDRSKVFSEELKNE